MSVADYITSLPLALHKHGRDWLKMRMSRSSDHRFVWNIFVAFCIAHDPTTVPVLQEFYGLAHIYAYVRDSIQRSPVFCMRSFICHLSDGNMFVKLIRLHLSIACEQMEPITGYDIKLSKQTPFNFTSNKPVDHQSYPCIQQAQSNVKTN